MLESLKFWTDETSGHETIAQGLRELQGDADAIILFPYDDGTFFPKQGMFDKDLLGGKGGYETPDGDKIVLDGDGEPKKDLFGVPMLLACDPTEHAGAVDPMKSYVAQKKNIGEWVKVDTAGNVLAVGDALVDLKDDIDIGLQDTKVEDKAMEDDMAIETALSEMEKSGEVRKIYDLAPPASASVNDEGEVEIEEATHVAVDQSKATDLMPKTTSTTELNTALDKARMEEYEEGRDFKYALYGGAAVFVAESVLVMIMFFAFQFF